MNLIPKINGELSLTGGTCRYGSGTRVTQVTAEGMPGEGYVLTVEPEEIKIKAGDGAGAFYARQIGRAHV